MLLPDKQVSTALGAPYAGARYYFSGSGNNLDTRMARAFTLPAGAQLTAQVRYDIEDGLGLRLSGRVHQWRGDVDGRADQPFGDDQSQRPELRQRDHRRHRRSLGDAQRQPLRLQRQRAARLPLLDRRRGGGRRLPGRRHRGDGRGRRWRRVRGGLGVRAGGRRVPCHHRRRVGALLQHLSDRVPPVPRDVRFEPADRALQLRVRQQRAAAELRRAVSLPGRAARQLLGRLAVGQRHQHPSRRRADPADRRASRTAHPARRQRAVERSAAGLRFDLRPRIGRT